MLRAELLKLTTTTAPKVAAGVGVVGLVLTQLAFVALLPALASGAIGPGPAALGDDLPTFDLGSGPAQLAALSPLGSTSGAGSIGIAVLSVLVLGVLAGTTDFRFGGIVGTALAEPRRGRIMAAKTGATALVGLVVGILFALVSVATLLLSLPLIGAPLDASALDMAGVLGRGAIVVALLTLLGLGVGILARSQLVGVLVMIGALLAELIVQATVQLVTGALPLWAQLLPLSLSQSAISADGVGALSPTVALGALAVLVAVVLAAATLALRRRDL